MTSPGQLAGLAARKLKCFRYSPPMGGFGGDYDFLIASVKFSDDTDLNRIVRQLDMTPPARWDERRTDLGRATLAGHAVDVTVDRGAWQVRDQNTIVLTLAMYVTEEHIAQAVEVERWLVDRGVTAEPAGR